MEDIGIVALLLIIINSVVTYKGLTEYAVMQAYTFDVDKILIGKDWQRMISSGFLHVNWWHFGFNMLSFYSFSNQLESFVGAFNFLLIYFASLVGGNLFALYVHRNHGDYTAVGASGAVCGIVFGSVALIPGMELGLIGIPIYIPAWIYAILFVGLTIFGIKSGKDNIGHEAHLGGALVGVLTALLIMPEAIFENYFVIAILVLPTIAFIYLIVTKPEILLTNAPIFNKPKETFSIDQNFNRKKTEEKSDLDSLLDKIQAEGMDSLTTEERRRLEEYSKR